MWAEKMAKPTFGVVVMCASVTFIHKSAPFAGVVTKPSRIADSGAVRRRRRSSPSQVQDSRCSARFASDEAIPAA